MQNEAEAHAEEDKKAKEAIETRNNADNLAYQCEKQLKDLGDKLDGATTKTIEDAIAKVREALKGDDVEAIKSAHDELQTKFQEVSAELYKQAAASQQAPGAEAGPGPEAGEANPSSKKDADVVDAEFEMVDEDKKK
jgi:molecular chaperone DnaK